MATEQQERKKSGQKKADSGGDDAEQTSSQLSAVQAAEEAKEQLSQLTGLPADTVSSVRGQDGAWEVGVELVELERLPPSTDVLASYQVSLDASGQLTGYERVQRYLRSQGQ